MKTGNLIFLIIFFAAIHFVNAQTVDSVGIYRTFERSLENNNAYSNKFSEVELTCTYISPSNDTTDFYGFFDGDGNGGGDMQTGNIWKIRFMPDEVGEWTYMWSWSDTTTGGEDTFMCDSAHAGKGILRAYKENPRWLAYNGTDPVWLKSYYESGHGAIAQPFDWITENVYQPMIDRGYNHFQVNWLLSLCCFSQFYNDGPAQSTSDLTLYQNGEVTGTMRLDVWKLMEQNVAWLNDRNVGLFMFLGFDGSRNSGPAWTGLSESEKDFYVRYVVARLAPYANIAGWNYVWEVPGDREDEELGWARLVQKYDVFGHLRTYQDEQPKYNEFNRPEYNFAGVENHRIHSDNREPEYWSAPWTHHKACLMGYVTGKPVYMVEGNALWRRYWVAKIKKETGKTVTLDEVRQSAWGCATAAASFTWCGHEGTSPLMAYGPQGLPFHGDVNPYAYSALQMDILSDVMNNEVAFFRMIPTDSLLVEQDTNNVWCLSEPGEQYLVFTIQGSPFKLQLAAGTYNSNQWISTTTGAGIIVPALTAADMEQILFTPPDSITDWVLLIRKEWEQNIAEEATILSAESDTSGLLVSVSCSKEMSVPSGYSYGFTITDTDSEVDLTISNITLDTSDKSTVIIEISDPVVKDKEIHLTYSGTLVSADSAILAPVKDLPVENKSKAEVIVYANNISNKLNCSIFPNPCSDYFNIISDLEIDIIRIFDMTGKLVFKKEGIPQTKIKISTSNFQPGIYLVYLASENINSFVMLAKK